MSEDFSDFLTRQNKSAQILQRVASLSGDPVDTIRTQSAGLHDSAVEQTHALARQADELEESYDDLLNELDALQKSVSNGDLRAKEAIAKLRDLRRARDGLRAGISSIRVRYEAADRTVKDPDAEREALVLRFPDLNR